MLQEFHYSHPVFDLPAIGAQAKMGDLQGRNRTWFAGAWMGYGFHEDGLRAAQSVVRQWLARRQASGVRA